MKYFNKNIGKYISNFLKSINSQISDEFGIPMNFTFI